MKKFVFAACAALFLTGCGVGSYSLSSGRADEATVSFTDTENYNIVVSVDDDTYNVQTVKTKSYKADRKIKQTSENTIRIATGQHRISVKADGKEIYAKNIFVSAGEHRIIEL